MADLNAGYLTAEVEGDIAEPATLRGAFHRAFGEPTSLADLVGTPPDELNTILARVRLPGEDGEDNIELTPV